MTQKQHLQQQKTQTKNMKKTVMTAMAVLVALVWFGTQQQAQSAPVLDQSQEIIVGANTAEIAVYSSRDLCQTFTANATGFLSGVSLYLPSGGTSDQQAPATISILGTTGVQNIPDPTNILWTGTFANLATGWFEVNTTNTYPAITSGNVYGIRITSTDPLPTNPNDSWSVQIAGNLYAAGSLFENKGSGWVAVTVGSNSYPNADAAFRTYVDAVPEPATVSLMILALSLTVVVTLRQRRPV
jgi:hypothetical protein